MGMVDTEYEITVKYARKLILLDKYSDEELAFVLELNVDTIKEIREELEEEGKLPKK